MRQKLSSPIAPEGRQMVATGVSLGFPIRSQLTPKGRKNDLLTGTLRSTTILRPSGAVLGNSAVPRLTPGTTFCRPSGAIPVAYFIAALVALTATVSAATDPATIARDAGIDQRLGEQIPADLPFLDETGQPVSLANYFGGDGAKPTLLVLAYYTCPDLCPMTLSRLTQGLNGIALEAGRDFHVVVVSFDPQDTPAVAASKRGQYLRAYKGHGEAGWHFLTGSQASIDGLKQAVGFRCTFEGGSNRYAHAAGVMAVTPGGRLSHYFFGTDFAPADLEAGLKDAMRGHATAVRQPDQQYCFAYDPRAGRYGRIITRTLQASGALWVLAMGGYIGLKVVQDFRGGGQGRPR